ncbi:MAG: hypothetical protein LBU11_10425 [Zoogloeaceae bacterium]|jgi:hypothetical protein|nr:hypothetical protein [Zoogloeaceae bacterium]
MQDTPAPGTGLGEAARHRIAGIKEASKNKLLFSAGLSKKGERNSFFFAAGTSKKLDSTCGRMHRTISTRVR